jgi:hypothetical protein
MDDVDVVLRDQLTENEDGLPIHAAPAADPLRWQAIPSCDVEHFQMRRLCGILKGSDQHPRAHSRELDGERHQNALGSIKAFAAAYQLQDIHGGTLIQWVCVS